MLRMLHRARTIVVILALGLLSACGESVWAPEAEVQKALWTAPGPPKITLFTVESTRNGSGAHSALLVSGSHRALFDPAGTFRHPHVPERNDVLFGITPDVLAVYIDYHARETFDVRIQEIDVSPAVAARAMALIQEAGPVPKAQCNLAVSGVLAQLPGFESVPRGWFPNKTADWLATRPGVRGRRVTDDDADDNHGVLIRAGAPVLIQTDDR